jgi:hypothetical protein
MPNSIKYSTTGDTQSLRDGNFYIGTGDVGKGPTSSTGHWNGITPPGGGYTVYKNKVSNGPAIWTATSDNQLISLTNNTEGTSFTTIQPCLNYYAAQTDKMVFNKDYEGIITSGLTVCLDAGFLSSYPGSGTTWYDISGNNNHFTIYNSLLYSSLSGGTFSFDGTNDYARSNSTIDLSTANAVTVQVIGNATNLGTLYEHSNDWNSNAGGFGLSTNSNGFTQTNQYMHFYWNTNGGTSQGARNFGPVEQSSYFFVSTKVLIKNNSDGLQDYYNGIRVPYVSSPWGTGTTTVGNTTNFRNDYFYVGGRGGSSAFLNGNVSLILIYNRALSSTEILKNYNASVARFNTSNIVKNDLVINLDASNSVSYPTSGTTWTDLSGNGNKGTLTNGPTFDSTSKSIVFDGVNDYVDCGNSVGNFGSSNFTINFLFKTTEQTYPATFIAKSIGDNPTINYGWLVNNGDNGTNLGFAVANTNSGWGSSGSYVIQTSGASINNGIWQMATIVGDRSQSNVSIYINGTLRSLKSYVTTTAALSTVGNITNTQNLTIGSESDIGVSPFPIDASIRLVRLYNKALSQSEVLQNFYGGPIVTNGLVMYLDAGNLVSYSGAGTTWYDLTTNGNNATFYNGVGFSSANGGGISFDGVDDYAVVLANSSLNSSQPTIELFMTTTTNGGNIIAQGQYGSNWGYGVGVKLSSILARNNNGDSNFSVSNSGLVHVVVVYDGSGNQFYKNGVFLGRTTTNYSPNPGGQVTIGGVRSQVPSQNLQEFANSTVSVVRIYNRALTADEISQNYNAQKSRFGL